VFGNPQHEVSKTLLAPLQHGCRPNCKASLQASPAAGCAVVLRLQFTGRTGLAALFATWAGGAPAAGRRGNHRRHALGQLMLAVQQPLDTHQLLERARRWAQGGGGAGPCGLIACCKACSTPC
jgi:D-methionine transport system ATP-binding protein